ncbi:jg6743 [Pararge aegeria aegeria]|uniref:Jg6743 protein n=1 Tax=Pararge aegeria aegeria TaxID=348720 RepID=A0A8S4R1J6_9NEOP|nr:jg6743 [Pararge aegeria aegeria]
MRSASYASAVYQPRRDADPYSASRFDGKKARGELDQTVLEHTLRNISLLPVLYLIPLDATYDTNCILMCCHELGQCKAHNSSQ